MKITQKIIDGLELNFPDHNVTIIDASSNDFSSLFQNFKIMDCAWCGDNQLWLFEFKVYFDPTNPLHKSTDLTTGNVYKEKVAELLQKTVGTLLLINDRYTTINKLPLGIDTSTEINILHVLKIKPNDTKILGQMNKLFNTKFKPFKEIFKPNLCRIIAYKDENTFLKLLDQIQQIKQ